MQEVTSITKLDSRKPEHFSYENNLQPVIARLHVNIPIIKHVFTPLQTSRESIVFFFFAVDIQCKNTIEAVRLHIHAPVAYKRVHSLAVATASASLVFQCFAMFSESGSSGLGALKRA